MEVDGDPKGVFQFLLQVPDVPPYARVGQGLVDKVDVT